jgi:hypothetical protein
LQLSSHAKIRFIRQKMESLEPFLPNTECNCGACFDERSVDMTATPVIVYFDGKCPLCSREVAHYRDQVKAEPVSFDDIAADNFGTVNHGLDLARAR